MCCVPRYKYSYGKCNGQQNPTFIEYFQIPLCRSGPDSQQINICDMSGDATGCVYNSYVAVLFT